MGFALILLQVSAINSRFGSRCRRCSAPRWEISPNRRAGGKCDGWRPGAASTRGEVNLSRIDSIRALEIRAARFIREEEVGKINY